MIFIKDKNTFDLAAENYFNSGYDELGVLPFDMRHQNG